MDCSKEVLGKYKNYKYLLCYIIVEKKIVEIIDRSYIYIYCIYGVKWFIIVIMHMLCFQ